MSQQFYPPFTLKVTGVSPVAIKLGEDPTTNAWRMRDFALGETIDVEVGREQGDFLLKVGAISKTEE